MYSDIIGFIAVYILFTVMLSGALAQSKRLGSTRRTRLLPSKQFPPQNEGIAPRDEDGQNFCGIDASIARLIAINVTCGNTTIVFIIFRV